MTIEEQQEAIRALGEEKGGQLLKEHCRKEIELAEQQWVGLLREEVEIGSQELQDMRLRYQAIVGSFRRIFWMLTDPSKETKDA